MESPPLLIIFLLILAATPPAVFARRRSGVNVWPEPRIFQWDCPYRAIYVSPNISFTAPSNPYLLRAATRCIDQIVNEHYNPIIAPVVSVSKSSIWLKSLHISVNDTLVPLRHGVDESYTIVISLSDTTVAKLMAETVWGAMRGLETFTQLVWGKPLLAPVGVYIWDAPLFGHRAVMLDTSRNYYPVENILGTIKAMSFNKLNVFHWHITDSQSFPLVLPSEPGLAAKGSYGKDMQYSPDDVAQIVQFGLDHGVRVIPEIDTPAHAGSWAGAYPNIVTCANMLWWPAGSSWEDRVASEPGSGHLNPLNLQTYEIVENVIRDVATMFTDSFYHGGADEIVPGCWKADPSIQFYLSQNETSLDQLLEKFINHTHSYITSFNKSVVYWEDVLLDADVRVNASSLPPETTILQTWKNGPNNTKLIASAGYRVIVSSSEFYYLDCGHGGFVGNDSQYDQPSRSSSGDGGSWCGPFKTWQTIYDYDITNGLTEEEAKLVLGGEVTLWSEQADATVLDARLWPRASALAESLWSGNRDESGMKRYAEAVDRLNEWRYRMLRRGINAEPLQPLWCLKNPGMCNLVHSS